MGLMKIQAETEAESQAICGILDLLWNHPTKFPASVLNAHGCRLLGGSHKNYCVIPDGSLDGTKTNIKIWRKLPDLYQFKTEK